MTDTRPAMMSRLRDLMARVPRLHPAMVALLWLGGLLTALAGAAMFGPVAHVVAFPIMAAFLGWWVLWALDVYRRACRAMSEPERPYMPKLALWVFAAGLVSGVCVATLRLLGLDGDDQPWLIRAPMDLLGLATAGPLLVMLWTGASAHARSFGPDPGGSRTLATFLGLFFAPIGVWFIKPR